jgi:FAD/FMN-containing dehydrogenase
MTLITRRQFAQQAAFSAGALYGFRFELAKATETLEQGGEKSASIDAAAIRTLASKITGHVVKPGSSDYESSRQVNNHAYDRHPGLIVVCASPEDIARALDFARRQSLTVAVRCGGHSAAGFGVCNGGIVIDLAGMKRIEVDVHKRIARAEAGSLIGDVDQATQRFGLATVMGGCPTVGIGGLTLGGGIGTLMPKYGAASDNVQSAELVTVDSRHVKASLDSNSDPF